MGRAEALSLGITAIPDKAEFYQGRKAPHGMTSPLLSADIKVLILVTRTSATTAMVAAQYPKGSR